MDKKNNIYKDITIIENREPGEYYIGDFVQVKRPGWLNVKNATLCGFNRNTGKWIIEYSNTKSGIKYDEIEEIYIVKLKSTSIKINDISDVHKYDKEIYNFINNER